MQNINTCLYVGPEDRAELERLVADGKTAQKIATLARIVLASGRGLGTNAIMREARTSKSSVWRWQKRYMEAGIKGLFKDRGKGKRAGKKPISEEIRLKIITKTVQERPANATHWSVRTMAKEMNVSHTTVQRIWKAHGLRPHLTRTFKLSNDPNFTEKVRDIVGL
jgi:transposase